MLKRGIRPDALTDQTSAHDPANGYCPAGWSAAHWQEMRERDWFTAGEALEHINEPALRELVRRVFGISQPNGLRLRGR